MKVNKRIDLALLQSELTAAAVPIPHGLGFEGTETDGEVYTYDAAGEIVDLPPSAAPVVDAHVAPLDPYEYSTTISIAAVIRTTNDTPREIYRLRLEPHRQYAATLAFLGIEPVNGATLLRDVRCCWKRLAAGAVAVGETTLSDLPEQASADWNTQVRAVGNDVVVEVIGERTGAVDWMVRGTADVFVPAGGL